MIQEGLEYSCVANGITRVLRVPYDDHSTLYYFLRDPNSEANVEVEDSVQQPKRSLGRLILGSHESGSAAVEALDADLIRSWVGYSWWLTCIRFNGICHSGNSYGC